MTHQINSWSNPLVDACEKCNLLFGDARQYKLGLRTVCALCLWIEEQALATAIAEAQQRENS